MLREPLPLETTQRILPSTLIRYAQGAGWQENAAHKRPEYALYERPDAPLAQVLLPSDPSYVDYAEAVADAVRTLATFAQRPALAVLDELLIAPADVLCIREVGAAAESGSLPMAHVVRLLDGTRRLLLATAQHVLVPQVDHPRRVRYEAEEFVQQCRLAPTERGSFVLRLACPLPTVIGAGVPFARRVTALLMRALRALVALTETVTPPLTPALASSLGLSANLCESLALVRPEDTRAYLAVTMQWSTLIPQDAPTTPVLLTPAVFDAATLFAAQLRPSAQRRRGRFIGYVEALRGQPSASDPRPAGEVDFTVLDDHQGELRASGVLDADDYAKAAAAQLAAQAVAFQATWQPLARLNRVEAITDFRVIEFTAAPPENSALATV